MQAMLSRKDVILMWIRQQNLLVNVPIKLLQLHTGTRSLQNLSRILSLQRSVDA